MGKEDLILCMGTYPPAKCGIATFTKDLVEAINIEYADAAGTEIIAVNHDLDFVDDYRNSIVKYIINRKDRSDYQKVALQINKNEKVKLVNIQHEFGIFGGELEIGGHHMGEYIFDFLEAIKKPVVISLHTVLASPVKEYRGFLSKLLNHKNIGAVVTNLEKGRKFLKDIYNVKKNIILIPHGVPTIEYGVSEKIKKNTKYEGRKILISFGLLKPSKGYEYALKSLPEVIKKYPEVLYLIVGKTSNSSFKKEGEKYRDNLRSLVKENKLDENVEFVNRYLTLEEIKFYLKAADIFIFSGLSASQICSGTIAYGLSAGKAVISTPILYAQETINDQRGILVDFRSSKAFADAIMKLLDNPALRETMGKESYRYSRQFTWENVAQKYIDLFNEVLIK